MAELIWDEDKIRDRLYAHDEQALEAVSCKYGSLLHSLAGRITGSDADAEECVNDALLDLWQAVPPDRPEHLLSYTASLVRRRAIDRVRYNTAKRRAGAEYVSSLDELAECLSDPDGESNLETVAIRQALQSFVDGLAPLDRSVFLLRYYRFESNSEIAKLCGLRETAVVMRLVRLRKRLRTYLESHGIFI